MRKRRVGTLSMAIVLISFGIMLLIAQINQVSATNILIKFWPIILLLLGGEILWCSYRHKEDEIIRYDIFSIFIILLIIIVSLGVYGLTETNAISKINSMISSQDYRFKIPYNEVEVPNDIEKIVIDAPKYCSLNVRAENGNKLISSGTVDITADSKEKAEELMNMKYIVPHKSDTTLFISLDGRTYGSEVGYSIHPYDFTLILPKDKKVEISNGSNLNLVLENIENDWVIDNMHDVNIRLGENTKVKINAFVDSKENLKGNVNWNVIENINENEEIKNVKGEIINENGEHIIYVLNCYQVTVDELK